MKAKVTAIILAAGKGRRMNSDIQKQYMLLCGKPVLYYSIKAFSDSTVDDIVIVTGEDERKFVQEAIVDRYELRKVRTVVAGGKERYDSAWLGLKACEDSDYVLIHDAARPMITENVIERVIENVIKYQAAVVGVPAKDTIKVADEEGYVKDTPPRKDLWVIQTPQAFFRPLLCSAYENMFADEPDKSRITDDSMVMEVYGKTKIKLVMGDYRNIKITTDEDMALAESMLENKDSNRQP